MRRRQRKTFRLVIETLESRRLLAGVNVAVYVDHNGSRSFEPTVDAVAPNRVVYVDLNANGKLDDGEPVTASDDSGLASFQNLGDGTFHIGLLTNPITQPQAAPVGIAGQGSVLNSWGIVEVFAGDGGQRWVLTGDGALSRLSDASSQPPLMLNGRLVSAFTHGNFGWMVTATAAGQSYLRLDLEAGKLEEFEPRGLAATESILQWTASGDEAVALVVDTDGSALARIGLDSGELSLEAGRFSTAADELVGSSGSSRILAIEGVGGQRVVQLLDAGDSFASVGQLPPMADIEQVTLSADASVVLVARSDGVHGFQVRSGGEVAPAAVLTEARAPITAVAADGRFTTASENVGELLVWNSSPWQQMGRSRSAVGRLTTLTSPHHGDAVLNLGPLGLEEFDLAVAQSQPITLGGGSSTALVSFGVRPPLMNSPPNAANVSRRRTDEDTTDRFSPQSLGVTDADGDRLLFAIEAVPQHGSLTTVDSHTWLYSPSQDYVGTDYATIVAFDGQTSTSFRLEWQVIGVNDPPLSISVTTEPLAEDSRPAEVGLVSVVDVDSGAEYLITTSDARFTVEHGRIHYIGGGLDFETEPRIALVVTAVDKTDQSLSISTETVIEVTNVAEPPSGIRLLGDRIDENFPGAVVGRIELTDPDASGSYMLTVSDGRFEIVGETLKLRDGHQVDFESEPSIGMTIRAFDSMANTSVTSEVTVLVNDLNDRPMSINLSGQSVEELVLGAVVGTVSVVDQDAQRYTISASDGRFEVVENILKLRDDVMLLRSDSEQVVIRLTATSGSGDSISGEFQIDVMGVRSPWQNPRDPLDVNDDGEVTPLDILLIINQLNQHGSHQLPALPSNGSGEPPAIRPDTSGDGFLSPLDALLIINALNRYRGEGEAAESQVLQPSSTGSSFDWLPTGQEAEEERRRQVRIDRELEVLLEQLAQSRSDSV